MAVVITAIVKTFVLYVASFQVILWSIRQGSLGVGDLKLASSSPYQHLASGSVKLPESWTMMSLAASKRWKKFKKLAHIAGHGHKLRSLHRVKRCGLIIL